MTLTEKIEVLGERPVQLPLCTQQNTHGLAWERSRAFRFRGHAQSITRPYYLHCTVSDSLLSHRSVNKVLVELQKKA